VLLLIVVFTRNRTTFQGILFLVLGAVIYCAKYLNVYLENNWEAFSRQPYFDKSGLFISIMLSGPLLVINMVIVVSRRHHPVGRGPRHSVVLSFPSMSHTPSTTDGPTHTHSLSPGEPLDRAERSDCAGEDGRAQGKGAREGKGIEKGKVGASQGVRHVVMWRASAAPG